MSRRLGAVQLTFCSLVYLAIATRSSIDFGRTQFANGAYSNFFDIQAKALLNGHLAVPKDSLGAEAFIVDGQEHLYFGIFPALLRMPVLALSDSLFGHLTVVSCFAAWLIFVVSAWRLGDMVLEHAAIDAERRWVRLGVPTAWRLAIALGSPMLMLAGPAWVFSEAIMWGVASATLFQWRLYTVFHQPSTRNQLWVGGA